MVSSTALLHELDSSFFSRKRLKVSDFEYQHQDSHICLGNHDDITSSMQPTAEGYSSHGYYIRCMTPSNSYLFYCCCNHIHKTSSGVQISVMFLRLAVIWMKNLFQGLQWR
jgi:hypothetical protein